MAALDKQARAPVILRVTEIAGYTDWVLIVSGRAERQVAAIADAIVDALRERGVKPRGVEGVREHLWDLLDYDDFMVHVFYHPVRGHYDLESMWSDAPRVELGLGPEVMDTADLDRLELPDELPAYRGGAAFGGFDDEFVPDDALEVGDEEPGEASDSDDEELGDPDPEADEFEEDEEDEFEEDEFEQDDDLEDEGGEGPSEAPGPAARSAPGSAAKPAAKGRGTARSARPAAGRRRN